MCIKCPNENCTAEYSDEFAISGNIKNSVYAVLFGVERAKDKMKRNMFWSIDDVNLNVLRCERCATIFDRKTNETLVVGNF